MRSVIGNDEIECSEFFIVYDESWTIITVYSSYISIDFVSLYSIRVRLITIKQVNIYVDLEFCLFL